MTDREELRERLKALEDEYYSLSLSDLYADTDGDNTVNGRNGD